MVSKFPGVSAAALAAKAILSDDEDEVAVVVFRTGPKKYAYFTGGKNISKGDLIIVPTESGNDLEAEVVLVSKAKRWVSKATRYVL